MFTGIVECVGKIVSISDNGTNKDFCVESSISNELKIDQSLSHDGVCLTVTQVVENKHFVSLVSETLDKSTLGYKQEGDLLNLERSMLNNGRFDGHIVQGHVDEIAEIVSITDMDGSWTFRFRFSKGSSQLIVEKGSICINGVSLTCFDVEENQFSVAIIPYTFENTSFHSLEAKEYVNIEFDILGKYVTKAISNNP